MEQETVHGIIFMQQNQGEISETDFLKKSPKHCLGACYGNVLTDLTVEAFMQTFSDTAD